MATKSFLNEAEIEESLAGVISAPSRVPGGDETRVQDFKADEFSRWLQTKLLEKLEAHPDWTLAGPIALGSWSRNELTPKSDIDLLFVGEEEAVRRLTTDLSKQGIKLRYRMPLNASDWTEGVEAFDLLALISAVALSPDVAEELAEQKLLIRKRWSEIRKQIATAMLEERKSRNERFDSISNYLEPNLKYGPGGLRDLEQALALKLLFPERFEHQDDHPFAVLDYYKRFFLLVRQRLHLSQGSSDLLAAPEQEAISKWLGFKSTKDFMKEIQKGVSRVSFYADWAFEQATASKARVAKVEKAVLEKPEALFDALEKDSSVLMQNRVRLKADGVFAEVKRDPKLQKMIGRKLTALLDPSRKEMPMVALFRSRLIDHCVPEFRRIVGHVQHDQYHRFSVDAHILQALRELSRVRKSPSRAGKLAKQVKSLSAKEWEILSFACLYHDIAKGRQGDHSVEGIGIAQEDLASFGKDRSFIREVTWIVERHLALSAAAFRENPSSPRTWGALAEKGVEGRRIALLAVFTFVDIRATNPEAWTAWKERLLAEIISHLEKPEASRAIAFSSELKKRKLGPEWVERLDSFLISMMSPKTLADDLALYLESREDLPPVVVRTRAGQTWIRFHSRLDRAGLFAHYVGLLAAAGLGIRHASIHTFTEAGVYDWFEVKTEKAPKQIEKLIELASKQTKAISPPKPVVFDRVSLVSSGADEWVISFRGKDQVGALLEAARALVDEGIAIRWARVHTWGRQIDDVFGVEAPKKEGDERGEKIFERLNSRFSASKYVD
jgi:[protein-PII] uridylyltransferase